MPIYEYKGQRYDIATDDPAAAKEKILGHLAGQTKPAAALTATPAPAEPNAQPGLLAGTTMPPQEGEYFPEKSVVGYGKDITAPPDVSQTPQMDVSKAPSAADVAARQFGITPEMSETEKALRTGKSMLYGASTGLEQTWLGGARLISDFTGLGKDGVVGVSQQLAKEQGAVEGTFDKEYGYKIAKNIGESVLQNIPAIYTGLAGGMTAAYGTMFGQSFLQTYDDSRNEGMNVGDSAARSALYGTAEVLGERIGLPALFKGIKDITKGVSAKELAKDAANYVLKDLTGEELTYVSQFLVDKGYGLNPQAGLKELFQGAIDTALVTVGQGAVMGGAGLATNKVLKELRKAHSKGEEAMPEEAVPEEAPAAAPAAPPEPAGKGIIQQGKNVTVEAAPADLEAYKAIPEEAIPTEDDERLAKFDELEKENNAINEKYKTATPEEFSILNARQGQIQDEMNKLVTEGLTASQKRVEEVEKPELITEKFKVTKPGEESETVKKRNENVKKAEELRQQAYDINKDVLDPESGLEGEELQAAAAKVRSLLKEADRLEKGESVIPSKAPEVKEEKPITKEERSALFEKNRIEKQNKALEKAKLETRTPLKEVTEDDLTVANKAMELAGQDVEMVDAALPYLKKLETAGLIKIKPGRRKSFTLTNSGEALRGSFYDMSYQEKQAALEDFLKGKPVSEIGKKPQTKAEVNKERQAKQREEAAKNKAEKEIEPEESDRLKNWLSGKDEYIKSLTNKGVSQAYANKVYDAQIKYIKDFDKAVANQDEALLRQAEKDRGIFTNKLNSVLERLQANKKPQTKQKEEAEKIIYGDIDEFVKDFPALRQAKIKKDLQADINYKGNITSRSELIEKLVSEGRTITEIEYKKPITKNQEEEKNQLSKKYIVGLSNENLPGVKRLKELQSIAKNGNITIQRVLGTKELHLAEDQITKTGIDYAQYLIKQKEKAPIQKAAKPVTESNIEAAVAKAGEKFDYAKIKKAAENQVDQAIKRTKFMTQKDYDAAKIPDADRYVNIKLEGAGSFKVMNNKERLEEFKKKLANAIKPKQAGIPRREWETAAVAFKAESAFKNFLSENEPETAIGIANITGLDINKVDLKPEQKKVLDKYLSEMKETGGEEPMMETIKSKPGVNAPRIAKMLGQQLYGNMNKIPEVSVKEMVQNSFDAIKTLIENKTADSGDIDIKVDKDKRTIEITDNGSGMTADVLANTFLTIAGTKKETEFGSGGFGIAKMQFLYGNKDLEVITMRDGKISHMKATGEQLLASLEDPSQAPNIEITTPKETPNLAKMFPDDSGTYVKVTIPKEYKEQSTGDMIPISIDDTFWGYDVLRKSPLFANIDVKFNGRTVYDMGKDFPAKEYTTFIDAKFDWGTARIYASKEQEDRYGSNAHILSNGLWQFDETIKVNPMDPYGDNIPHRFYIDIVSKVKPDQDGYPFELNRQGFTKQAKSDLHLIKNYLTLHYNQKDYNNTVTNFGNVQYLNRVGKNIEKSEPVQLAPEVAKKSQKEGIAEGAKVEVKDGKLIVDGKVIPVLTPEDLKNARIDVSELRIDQDKVDPNKVMIHDNLEVVTNPLMGKVTGKDYQPITQYAREKFGDRFDKFMYDIGDTFMALRDATSRLMPADKKGEDYKDLAKEAIGVSFDKEYRGVSITIPFKGLYINPAFPEFLDTPEEAALGMFGTMIHELAHHKVRSHNADFPAEMQRILIKLESAPSFDIQQLKNDFILTVKENKDIIDFLNKVGSNEDNRAIGQRFKDSAYQERGEGAPEDISEQRKQGRGALGLPSELRPSYQAIGPKRKPKPVPPKAKEELDEEYLAQREADGRTDFPLETTPSVKDMLLGAYTETRKLSKQLIENPMIPLKKMVSGLDRAVTWARIKGIYFGKGLEIFEVRKYGGQVKDTEKRAIASVAVTNALHGAEIAVEGVMIGGVKFNTNTQMFQAVDMPQSLIKVVEIEHDLAERIGHQEAANMVQDYFEAKRSRSILDAFLKQEGIVEKAKEKVSKLEIGTDEHLEALSELDDAKKRFLDIVVARSKVKLGDESIEVYSRLDEEYPELADMMENWQAVNANNLDNLEFSGIISKKRAKQLRDIKDYVPWQRLQDDMEDVHSAPTRTTKNLTNVSKEKIFRRNAAITRAAQDYVDEKIDLDEFNEAVQNYQEDLGEIDNIVDNMIHNTMSITMNSIRNHAANAVAMRFAERYTDGKKKGKLKVFATEGTDKEGVRFNIIVNGRRIIVRITDPLIAQAVLGMENIAIPGMKYFSDVSNILRRTVTIWPQFQLRQLSMDAATAAFVSGLNMKNSGLVFAKSFSSFVRALNAQDPIIKYLRSYGIGGLQSYARSPKKIIKQKIGLVEHDKLAQFTNLLDKIGDSSDLAPRVATYKQVLAETGDETLALMRAHNLIDWKRHGSSRIAVALSRSVTFMSAYANQIDVLVDALSGGGLRGKSRMAALTALAKIGSAMAFYTLVYAMLVGGNPDYEELDDETKARNFVIPKSLTKYIGMSTNILLPMNTSAAFWFKALPENIYNYVSKKGTQYEVDYTRFKTAMATAAIDALLGPTPIPTGIKPFAEIKLNHNFFTGGTVTPKGLAGLDAEEQYNATTSEMGKVFSSLMGGALNPMEMDHMIRGIFGTTGAVVMWGSNMLAGEHPTAEDRYNPLWGGIIDREVGRGPESLFYDLRDRVEPKYNTFNKLLEREKFEEADKYYNEHEKEIATHDYIVGIDEALKDINKEIRRLGESKDKTMTKEERLKDIQDLQKTKNEILSDVIQFRKDAGL